MLKKFVSLAVGTACLFSMVGVSAVTVQTSTAYQASDIKVTTTVSATTDGELNGTTLTYLAHDAGEVTEGSQIVYVDQIVADAESETFEYVTQYSKIGSTVKVGGRTSAGTALSVNTGVIPGVELTVDGVAVTDAVFTVVTEDADGYTADDDLVKITSEAFTGVTGIASMTGSGTTIPEDSYFVGKDCVWVKYGVLNVSKESGLAITLDTTTTPDVATAALGYKMNNDTDGPSAIAVGQALGTVAEYGIVYSADAKIDAAPVAYADVTAVGDVAFPALGKGSNGLYAVEVYNVADFVGTLSGNMVYAAAYVKDSSGNYTFGNVFVVDTTKTIAGEAVAEAASLTSVDAKEEVVEEEAIIYDVVEEDVVDVIEIEDVIDIEEVEDVDVVDIVE